VVWEVTPWRPFEFDKLRREMDRLWDSFFERKPTRRGSEELERFLSFDVAETNCDLVVKVELPGMDPKDIDISLNEGVLTNKDEKNRKRAN